MQFLEFLLEHRKQRQWLRRRTILGSAVGNPACRMVAYHPSPNPLFIRGGFSLYRLLGRQPIDFRPLDQSHEFGAALESLG